MTDPLTHNAAIEAAANIAERKAERSERIGLGDFLSLRAVQNAILALRIPEGSQPVPAEVGVGVMPLEWADHGDKDPIVQSRADTILGTYFICDDADDFTGLYLELISHDDARWWQHVRSTSETIMENYHGDDLSPLKAAAQADYERRILSALTTSGPSVAECARVLLEAEKAKQIDLMNVDGSQDIEQLAIEYAGNRLDAVGQLEIAEKFMRVSLSLLASDKGAV